MAARKRSSRHTGHAGGRAEKARPEGPESRDCNPCGLRSRKKHAGSNRVKMPCLWGRFSTTTAAKPDLRTKIRKRKTRLPGQNPLAAGVAVTLAAFTVHGRGSGAFSLPSPGVFSKCDTLAAMRAALVSAARWWALSVKKARVAPAHNILFEKRPSGARRSPPARPRRFHFSRNFHEKNGDTPLPITLLTWGIGKRRSSLEYYDGR